MLVNFRVDSNAHLSTKEGIRRGVKQERQPCFFAENELLLPRTENLREKENKSQHAYSAEDSIHFLLQNSFIL